jgi:hypothetical protein
MHLDLDAANSRDPFGVTLNEEMTMKRALSMIALILALPLTANAQGYANLDTAEANLARGFSAGESRAIVAGLSDGDQVKLQFPGLIEESGFFGRDQASYLLEKLFSAAQPVGYEKRRWRKVSSEGQYHITADWTIQRGGTREVVPLSIVLQLKGERWVLASAQSATR